MANQKISELAAVTDLLTTDEYVLARAGSSKKITGANLKAGVLSSVGDITITSDSGATGTGEIVFRPKNISSPTSPIRISNSGQLLYRNPAGGSFTAKPLGDGSPGLVDLKIDDTIGYLFHLHTGANSGAGVACIGIGTDEGSGAGILISQKAAGIGFSLSHNPAASAAGAFVFSYSALNFGFRFDSYVGAKGMQLTSQLGAGFADGVANGTTTFTSATAAFVAGDVGATLQQLTSTPTTPTVIPNGVTIVGFTNATTVTLSAAATGSATNIQFLVGSRPPSTSQGLLQLQAAVSFQQLLSTIKAGDAQSKFYIQEHGGLNWGSGAASIDTNLYRATNGRLGTDHQFIALQGVHTKVVAGTVSDASFTRAPADGMMALDSTGSKIWVRMGGVWKSVAVA